MTHDEQQQAASDTHNRWLLREMLSHIQFTDLSTAEVSALVDVISFAHSRVLEEATPNASVMRLVKR